MFSFLTLIPKEINYFWRKMPERAKLPKKAWIRALMKHSYKYSVSKWNRLRTACKKWSPGKNLKRIKRKWGLFLIALIFLLLRILRKWRYLLCFTLEYETLRQLEQNKHCCLLCCPAFIYVSTYKTVNVTSFSR
jgi:hypothetical protein